MIRLFSKIYLNFLQLRSVNTVFKLHSFECWKVRIRFFFSTRCIDLLVSSIYLIIILENFAKTIIFFIVRIFFKSYPPKNIFCIKCDYRSYGQEWLWPIFLCYKMKLSDLFDGKMCKYKKTSLTVQNIKFKFFHTVLKLEFRFFLLSPKNSFV